MISICIKNNNLNILDFLAEKIEQKKFDNVIFSKHSFKNYNNVIVHYTGNGVKEFYKFITNILVKIILKYYEPILVKRFINENYFYFDTNEKKIIYEEYKLLLKNHITNENLISIPLEEYLKDNKSIILDGFVNFRIPSYILNIKTLVAESVNQYIIDKEYIDFVNILRDYVNSQNSKTNIVNLIYINSEGILLSSKGDYIDLEKFNSIYLSDISFSKNDYILNTLIGVLPNKIMLHLISPKDQFIKTIELIFEGKVKYCKNCNLCQAYSLLSLK